MNKNSKNFRKLLAKEKGMITCNRLRTQPGSTALVNQAFTLNYGTQARVSKAGEPKVARAGCKNPSGPSILEQCEIFYGSNFRKV